MKLRFFIFAICAGLCAQGCVSASKHEKLQQDFAQASADLADYKAKYSSDESRVREEEEKLHHMDLIIKDLESKLVSSSAAQRRLEGSVNEMKAALEALTKQRAETEKRIQDYREFVKKFRHLTDTGKLTVKIVDGQMVVALSSDVLFASGSAKLSDAGADSVKQVTAVLASVPDRRFQIEGFTDNVPIKTAVFPSNWELASARALTVLKAMLDAEMPADRVSAAGFGESHPIQSNDTEEGRAANRRIEIVVVPDLSSLPGYDELQKMANY